MTTRTGIKGFGRIGRLPLRGLWEHPDLRCMQINDPAGDAATLAHLLIFDSVHGRWQYEVDGEGLRHTAGGTAWVYRVKPAKVLAFTKGTFTHTSYVPPET